MQRTIEKEVSLEGIGLHTGKKTTLTFKPLPAGEGIKFKRVDLKPEKTIPLNDFDTGRHKRRTTISKDGVEVHTVEHLLAALWALSIDNILIELDNMELPGLDGSARDFVACLKEAGVKEQSAPSKVIKINEPAWRENDEAFIGVFPGTGFKVSYLLDMPVPSIGRQCLSLELDRDSFYKEIAGARTFCMKEEAEALLKQGFGKGANTQNTLVMDEKGPIDNELRYPDEHVRHKILDLVGDLYLSGSRIEGRVIAIRSGHELNMQLVEEIMKNARLNDAVGQAK